MQVGRKVLALAALGAGAMASASALAAAGPVTILNPSFETPGPFPGLPVSLIIDNWTTAGPGPYADFGDGSGPHNPNTGSFPNTAAGTAQHIAGIDGNQAVYIYNIPGEEIFQTLSTNFSGAAADGHYILTASFANASNDPPAPPTDSLRFGLFYTLDMPGLSDPAVAANRHFVATSYVRNGSDHPLAGYTATGTTITDYSAFTDALPAEAIGRPINVIFYTDDGTGGKQFDIDNVRLAAVPEPGSLCLLGLAGAGLLARRRRR